MKVNKVLGLIRPPNNLHSKVEIQFGVPPDGNSSASEKRNTPPEASVRLAWYGLDGRFDPFSSAELPRDELVHVISACAETDFFDAAQATQLVKALQASIDKQSGDK